jgi:hypothetical protein
LSPFPHLSASINFQIEIFFLILNNRNTRFRNDRFGNDFLKG